MPVQHKGHQKSTYLTLKNNQPLTNTLHTVLVEELDPTSLTLRFPKPNTFNV